jgi:secondary thiamine-phosphate synthase enzyme
VLTILNSIRGRTRIRITFERAQGAAVHNRFTIQTRGQGLYEFTPQVTAFVRDSGTATGLLTLFVRHTSCSLLIQENADPEVQTDLRNYFARLVPPTSDPSMAYLTHTYEGTDDMPAHIKAAMMPVSLSIPISDGHLALGTWQGIYLFEHRDAPHNRTVAGHISP